MPRRLLSLLAGAAIGLTALDASAAFFTVRELGGNEWGVQLLGEPGDVPTTLAAVDIQDIVLTVLTGGGATFVSHNPTTSIFQGKPLGPTNTILNPTTFRVGGSDLTESIVFDSTSVLPLGNFTLSSSAFIFMELGGNGLYTATAGSGQPPIVITNDPDFPLCCAHVPEPGFAPLLGLALAIAGLGRRKRRRCPGSRPSTGARRLLR